MRPKGGSHGQVDRHGNEEAISVSPAVALMARRRHKRNPKTQQLVAWKWEGVRKQWQLDAKRPDTPAARRRCRQLIELGPAYVSWDDVVGRR